MASLREAFWPDIADADSARKAAKNAAAGAFLIATMTTAFAVYAMFNGPVLGFDGWNVIDAGFAAVIGWRLLKMSKAWAVVGLIYWGFNTLTKVMAPQEGLRPVTIVSIIILLAFINGVRGTFAYAHLKSDAPQPTA